MSSSKSRSRLDAASLLTAIPALLGFIPERSIIILFVGPGRTVRATMRHDLAVDDDGTPQPALLRVFAELGSICARYGARDLLVAIVDDRFALDDPCHRRVLALANREFSASGGVSIGFVLNEFDCGAAWSVAWRPRANRPAPIAVPKAGAGVLADPRTCPTAIATAVSTGRRLLSSRSEMQQMLVPSPRCAEPVCNHLDAPNEPLDGVGAQDTAEHRRLLALIVDRVQAGPPKLDCSTLNELERAILTLPVRDAALALAVTDLRDGAELLWRELTRRLQKQGRASAATMLAHLHYIGGEGAYAGVALDAALAADPSWSLAGLLDRALRNGMRPNTLWEMIDDSYRAAAELGVVIPNPTLRAVG